MPATVPFEIIAAPFDIYVAPVGTTFTDVSQTPSASWFLLGTSGSKNYDEEGVKIKHEQKIEEFRFLGLTAPRKASRTEESLTIGFKVADVSAAQYAKILNNVALTNTAAAVLQGGNLNFPLLLGLGSPALYALIARCNESAGGVNFNTQYEVPIVYQGSSPEVLYMKGNPAQLECEFHALWDSALGFGRLRSQNVVAS